MQDGLILKGIGGFYYVKSGSELYECKPRGLFRKKELSPVAGDIVAISIVDENRKEGVIEKIYNRKSFLVRPPVANIDQVILAFAAKSPVPDFLLLDKLLVRIISLDLKPIICINKVDLDTDKSTINLFEKYSTGFSTIFMSASSNIGVEELINLLNGKISILAGPSGVGKSTITNKIHSGNKAEIGNLSEKNKKGKHTTRHVELFEIGENSYIADTPGFTSFNIDDIPYNKLQEYYPEFIDYNNGCKFVGCSHISEPYCAVKAAIEDEKIDQNRYNRYKQLFGNLKKIERYKG